MESREQKSGNRFMIKLATFIVDKRNLFFLLTTILLIFSAFSRSWVQVESELAAYLPEDSQTRQALDIMEEQFVTFGSAQVMVANITQDQAAELCTLITDIKGVQGVEYDDTEEYYNNGSALYNITFLYDESDEECMTSLEAVRSALSGYDVYVSTELGNAEQEAIDNEVSVIMIYVSVIIVLVLIFTSQTYAEVPVLILTFIAAMIMNLGTNFLLGKISFVSNSVTSILQLALSLDYAVIFCNRYKEEHQILPRREAVITALSKAIPEIGASSLTTIGGLVAMMFMQFGIGADMAVCLIKSILFALLAVFVVMSGLLMLFGPLMEKTEHPTFVPKIPFVGRFAYKTRFVIPVVFVIVVAIAFPLSQKCPYAYGESSLETPVLNETQIAQNMIDDNFASNNMLALMVPAGDYEKEKKILLELEEYEQVDSAMGIANVEAMGGWTLADQLTPREFSELTGLDYEAAQAVYAAYAAQREEYGQILGNLDSYQVPLIDMFLFVCEQADSGIVDLDEEQAKMLDEAYTQMTAAKKQLQGSDYSRMLIYLNLPESGEDTYQFVDTIQETAQKYYPDEMVYVAGNSTTEYDFQKAFARDNLVVSVVSILIVLVVLLFTFKSAGMPVLLIMVIQGSIWINFSMPYLLDQPLFFMSYLVVSSIQMGANIDYAIVVANRYQELKEQMHHKDAIIETMNFAFPTIITSGTILAVAGTLIGRMTSTASITGIGQNLGRGTIISILLVMFVLPQILLVGGKVVDRTSFSMPAVARKHTKRGRIKVDGMVRGEVCGTISGTMRATVDGQVDLNVISGTAVAEEDEDE